MVLAPGCQLPILPSLLSLLSAHPRFSGCHWQAKALQKRQNLLVAAFVHNFPHTACKRVQQLNSNKGHKQIFQFLTIRVWHLVSDSAYYFQNCDILLKCNLSAFIAPRFLSTGPLVTLPLHLNRLFWYFTVNLEEETMPLSCQLYQLSSSSARPATRLDYSLKHQMFRYLGRFGEKKAEPQAKQGLDPFEICKSVNHM